MREAPDLLPEGFKPPEDNGDHTVNAAAVVNERRAAEVSSKPTVHQDVQRLLDVAHQLSDQADLLIAGAQDLKTGCQDLITKFGA